MARRHQHEEHANHEAWAIPYGDLVTLLLAFFVVMYAISSVNEGKYRVMADALNSAFGGPPRTIAPVRLGQTQLQGSNFDRPSMQTAAAKTGPAAVSPVSVVRVRQVLDMPTFGRHAGAKAAAGEPGQSGKAGETLRARERQLNSLGRQIQQALSELVRKNLVTVRRGHNFLEVEIQSDILFASGSALPSPVATSTVRKLAGVLRGEANAVRVEGYTDDRPIRTALFESNWELSAARAVSVVHVMTEEGVAPKRLAVVGYGEHQPVADNLTEAGRNANRRVLLVILAAPEGPDAVPEGGPTLALVPDAAPTVAQATGVNPTGAVVLVPSLPDSAPAPVHSPSTSAARKAQPRAGHAPSQDAGLADSRAAPQPGAG
ncbi:flagellar motor protein MotD [Agrilutibacter solisilvae]|uniref:Flagellar motor protein MotD n=1 Tax=Agrilutibacter solisilvae TaxID=2763317 RepID=A0A974XXE3_9GAMM|nr:flagellar motor protein MotD [Lysobacter solisilvae]QSX77592.1 flagellar motor protein MotD [Lysobacter solisilvae]